VACGHAWAKPTERAPWAEGPEAGAEGQARAAPEAPGGEEPGEERHG
jgi:hypothetical protein